MTDLDKFDISNLPEEGVFLHLEDPATGLELWRIGDEITAEKPKDAGDDLRVGVWLISLDSTEVKKVEHKISDSRMKKVRIRRGGRVDGASAREQEDAATIMLAAATKRLQNIVVKGEEWDASKARELYRRFPPFRRQVDEFLNDDAAFLGN